jgi:hypothetical protein
MGGRLFGGADHGWQDIGLERRAWTLAQAVSGSSGPQGAAPDVSALRVGIDRSWRPQEHCDVLPQCPVTDADCAGAIAARGRYLWHNFQPNRFEQLLYVLAAEMLDHKNSICSFFRIASKIFHMRVSQFFYLAFCRWAYRQT